MTKYLIFAVSYSEDDEHIDWLLISRQEGRRLMGTFIASRAFVVDLIKTESASFETAVIRGFTFYPGAEVNIYDEEFLTTSADASEENNLQRLPVFSVPEEEILLSIKKALEEASASD